MRRQLIGGMFIESDNEIREGRRIHGYGTITDRQEGVQPDKSMCAGCEDDFYNRQGGMDGTGCWSFKNAVVCNKVGHASIYVENGPNVIMKGTLSCWHAVSK